MAAIVVGARGGPPVRAASKGPCANDEMVAITDACCPPAVDEGTMPPGCTADPKLFQTQRVDPYGYRFDNVPNGTYQIELEFADLNAKEKIGKRLFDVIVEDTLILPAHDIVYEVGTMTAESRTFFLSVTDGQMDIRLIPRAGSDPPVINAARITHRLDR